jgi:hypothetical protein
MASFQTRLRRRIGRQALPIIRALRSVARRALRIGADPQKAMRRYRVERKFWRSDKEWRKANAKYIRQRRAYRQRFGRMPPGMNELPR